jgi:hypothetical protein
MSEPEQIGKILDRIFPSLLKRHKIMSAETVELKSCRCCGQPTLVSELSPSDECSSCTDKLLS